MAIKIIEFATGFQTDESPGTAVDASTITVEPAGDLSSTDLQSALEELQGDIDVSEAAHAAHVANVSNPHSVTKAQVGLGNADNTSDANKPVSTAQQTALDLKADAAVTTAALALKADAAATTASLATKADLNSSFLVSEAAAIVSNTITPSSTKPTQRITGTASDLQMIATPVADRVRVLINETGSDITIKNDTGGTAANRIYTGTGLDFTLKNNATALALYDATLARWMLIGGGGSGGPVVVSKTANYTGNINEVVEADPSAGAFTVTAPTIPASGGTFVVIDASEAASATKYIRVSAPQAMGNLPVGGSWLIDYPMGSLVLYAAPGATSWKVQYQTTSMVQGGQVPGSTAGSATGSGFIGEMFGTLRSGTGGFTQTTRTTTGLTTTPSNVVSFTLNKGVYMVGGFTNLLGSGTSNARYRLYIGGTMVVVSTASTIASSAQASTLYMPGVPVNITTDGTVVAFFGSVDAGTATAENEAWCIRVG